MSAFSDCVSLCQSVSPYKCLCQPDISLLSVYQAFPGKIFVQNSIFPLIFLMYSVYSMCCAGSVIRPRRVSMMLVLLRRLSLRLTKVDMLASGADLVIRNEVFGSCG